MADFFRWAHPLFFSIIVVFAIIELSISAWLVAKYNARHNFTHRSLRTRVRYTLFVSIWTVLFGTIFLIMFLVASTGFILTSIATHGIFVFMTWVLWVAAAAAVTQSVGGNLHCSTQTEFVYCGHLNALIAFAWMIWIFLTFLLVAIIVRGVIVVRRGEGYGGGLVDE
ncbi:uncharacterized protein LACBIDRAFT_312872 [Laccaria bicolor S238N-H82]|uniref:Predicted protein n=1 Tax=Laccaria bicolor (strain S238N-H82 / ATCC MYA-4686) TaxID=486041 RepID=B0DX05_LACBS|nr:uncharacterized protein LACBIDRAFT_312872 [Laccaria bicolor S238N-H82]EDR00850.1 predicted protein [Laccaria bicolor S238N-H82]|eukprot:XP_001888444.1 predicted protein [Laccaria bicolor S238N-H82]